MFRFIREHSGSMVFSVLLHVLIVVALVGGFIKFGSKPEPIQPAQLAIQATVVDEKQVQAEMNRQQREKEREERQARERAEQLKQEQEAEQQRLDDLKRQRETEEANQRERVEQRRVAEQERKREADAEAKRKADATAKAEAERRRKAESDRKAKVEEDRRKAAEAEARAAKEAELKAKLADEARREAAINSGVLAQWVAQVQGRVQRAWIRPPNARSGLKCQVTVTWAPTGEVLSVAVGECNGDDVVRRSIETAVQRASPLPVPSDPSLYQRTFKLEFKPND